MIAINTVTPVSINETILTLTAALLTLAWLAGLTLLEVGCGQAKHAGNTIMKNLAVCAFGSMGFLLVGYGLMFGVSQGGLVGCSNFLFPHLMEWEKIKGLDPGHLFFQMLLAGTTAVIVSGVLAERAKWGCYLLSGFLVGGLIYPLSGHWLWGGGWLAQCGTVEVAGSLVVLSLGGWTALAATLVLGPRIGRFKTKGVSHFFPEHNFPLAALGVFILWFGWFGMNIGRITKPTSLALAMMALNTFCAGLAGFFAAMGLTWLIEKKPRLNPSLKGIVAGLITSSATSAVVNPVSAIFIAAIGGVLFVLSRKILEKLKVDEVKDTISLFGVNGLWGSLAVGLLAQPGFSQSSLGIFLPGLLFGGGIMLLAWQAFGCLAVLVWGFGSGYLVFKAIDKTIGCRVLPEEEERGLDYSEHLSSAYPLFDEWRSKQEQISHELQRVQELSTLHEISQSIHSLNLDEILHLILRGVTHSIGFDRARLYLINEEEQVLECKMAVGIEEEKIKNITLPLDKQSIMSRVVLEKRAFVVQDAKSDTRVNPDLKKLFNLRSFVAVPLQGKNRVMGAVSADYIYSNKSITKEKVESLITFANQAGLALENAKLYLELKLFNEELEERVKQATLNLKKTQDQLIQSSRLSALGQLSAGVAHEIRNPLTSIRILIHSLRERLGPDDFRKEDMAVIENEIERMNQIIQQFLDFARPSKPKKERVEVNKLLEDTLLFVSYELNEQNIDAVTEFSTLPMIMADREQLRQVFLNLILNAMQAMPEGGTIHLRTTILEDNCLQIAIEDQGGGIPESIQEQLFEPFFTTKEDGIGLGLSITKRIIDDHQGEIEVESQGGKGTAFLITLPFT